MKQKANTQLSIPDKERRKLLCVFRMANAAFSVTKAFKELAGTEAGTPTRMERLHVVMVHELEKIEPSLRRVNWLFDAMEREAMLNSMTNMKRFPPGGISSRN